MTHCCGEDRQSNYCPDCGAPLATAVAVQLLKHLDHQVERVTNELEATRTRNPQSRHVPRKQKLLAKWTSWRDALKDLIDGEGK